MYSKIFMRKDLFELSTTQGRKRSGMHITYLHCCCSRKLIPHKVEAVDARGKCISVSMNSIPNNTTHLAHGSSQCHHRLRGRSKRAHAHRLPAFRHNPKEEKTRWIQEKFLRGFTLSHSTEHTYVLNCLAGTYAFAIDEKTEDINLQKYNSGERRGQEVCMQRISTII